jgi:NUMOD3 motif
MHNQPHTPAAIEKIRQAHLGRTLSQETKDKISDATRGKEISQATRALLRAANLGKVLSEEHKKRIGDANRGGTRTDIPTLTGIALIS